jgi:hypothetical protein
MTRPAVEALVGELGGGHDTGCRVLAPTYGRECTCSFDRRYMARQALRELLADGARLDALETLALSAEVGNGLAIFPTTLASTGGDRCWMLQGLGEEDGSNLGEELHSNRPTLRAAIDAAIGQQEKQP